MLSLLCDGFWSAVGEFFKNEWLGLLASAFILVSFLTTNQTKTRIINMVGCVVFVVYGFLLPAYSTAFMNAALFVVHVVYLTKDYMKAKKEKAEASQLDTDATSDAEAPTAEPSSTDNE